jgi:protein-S-isoprenylcysteine O-methyltransferase Ste14
MRNTLGGRDVSGVGRGLRLRPLLFDVPPLYGRVFIIVVALWVVPEIIGAFLLRSGDTAVKQDRGSYAVFVGGVALGVVGAMACASRLPQFAITEYRYAVYWLGIVVMVLGIALRWYAIRTLGSGFTHDVATTKDQVLVERGPYRLIRHPAYSATLLTMLGLGLALGNVASVAAALAIGLSGMLYRIRVEERALLVAFGSTYTDYTNRTKRLIPFVW